MDDIKKKRKKKKQVCLVNCAIVSFADPLNQFELLMGIHSTGQFLQSFHLEGLALLSLLLLSFFFFLLLLFEQ